MKKYVILFIALIFLLSACKEKNAEYTQQTKVGQKFDVNRGLLIESNEKWDKYSLTAWESGSYLGTYYYTVDKKGIILSIWRKTNKMGN